MFVSGKEELLQRAKICLLVRRGSFSYDTKLGSRLHTLNFLDRDFNQRAKELAEEALADLPRISVEQVSCVFIEESKAMLTALLNTPYGEGSIQLKLSKGEQ